MNSGIELPLVDKEYLLEKFPGKGGWTFASIPEILPDKRSHFGWVRVRGSIDGFQIRSYHLMPMGDGKLFLPVKAGIRKSIRKQAGDYVHVILFADHLPIEIPEEFKICLQSEWNALETFLSYSNGEQKRMIDWIYAAKTEETKVRRILKTLDTVMRSGKIRK
jgi:hypothetical protein